MTNYADALYEAKRGFMIVGLTGYTGSGCTTATGLLRRSSKPELPNYELLKKHVDKLRYDKLLRVWNNFEWTSFVDIEVSRIIFMLAISKSFRINYKKGPLQTIRKLSFPYKKELSGIKFLYKKNVNLRNKRIASQLVAAYAKTKTLYGQFKASFDLAEFIETMQNFGDDVRKFGQIMPASRVISSPDNMKVLPEAIRRLIRAYRTDSNAAHFVIDAFRNPYEVEYFNRRYNEFYLVAIHRNFIERRAALQKLPPDFIEKMEIREGGKKHEKKRDNAAIWVTSQNLDEPAFNREVQHKKQRLQSVFCSLGIS